MEFGCKLSPCDLRDYRLKSEAATASALPEEYFCELTTPVKNQKSVCSCVAHAVSSILEYHAKGQYKLSTNFIYGIQKKLCNYEGKGMYLRDACKIVANYGDMLLEDCPGNVEVPKCYAIAEEALADKAKANRAKVFRVLKYFSCSSIKDIKQAIYSHGPVLASIRWYDTFKATKDGSLTGEQRGSYTHHAIMIYGYTPDGFWCQNSWGSSWGKNGRFFIPYSLTIREARGFIDLENDAEVQGLFEPRTNNLLDKLYKILNFIINLFKKIFTR